MTISTVASREYAHQASAIRTPRSTEYDIFAKVTGALKRASTHGQRVAAIADNRRLWTELAADVAGSGNDLSDSLRGQIFYLAEFTEYHSRRVLKGEAEPDALVDINTSIMSGLRTRGAGG